MNYYLNFVSNLKNHTKLNIFCTKINFKGTRPSVIFVTRKLREKLGSKRIKNKHQVISRVGLQLKAAKEKERNTLNRAKKTLNLLLPLLPNKATTMKIRV